MINRKTTLTILFLLLFNSVNHYFYVKNTANFPLDHTTAIHYNDILEDSSYISDFKFKEYFKKIHRLGGYAPLYSISLTAVNLITGNNWMVMNMIVNTLYLGIFLLFIFLIVKKLSSEQSAIITIMSAVLIPALFLSSWGNYKEFALLSALSASYYFFLCSEDFNNNLYTIAFFTASALGMLIKYPFAAFIIFIIFYGFFKSVRQVLKKDFNSIKNFTYGTIVFFLLISPYYFSKNVLIHIIRDPFNEKLGHIWYSYHNLRLFTAGLSESLLGPLFFVLFVLSIIIIIRNKNKKNYIILLLSILLPNLILIFIPHWKDARFLVPQIAVFIIVISEGIKWLLKRGKAAFIAVFFITALAQYYHIQYLNSGNNKSKLISFFSESDFYRTHSEAVKTAESVNYYSDLLINLSEKTGKDSFFCITSANEQWEVKRGITFSMIQAAISAKGSYCILENLETSFSKFDSLINSSAKPVLVFFTKGQDINDINQLSDIFFTIFIDSYNFNFKINANIDTENILPPEIDWAYYKDRWVEYISVYYLAGRIESENGEEIIYLLKKDKTI